MGTLKIGKCCELLGRFGTDLYLCLGRHYQRANVNSIQVQFNFKSRPDLVKNRTNRLY